MSWRETQAAFAAAVREPSLGVPAGVGLPGSRAPTARFNVYRNNSAVGLAEGLSDSFPVVSQLVGDEFFAAMAQAYAAENLPTSPVMLYYGSSFPEFVSNFEPARSLPFLMDVARLEWAWLVAYHAPDRESVTADVLQSIAPEQLSSSTIELHPSLQLIESAFPAVSIWSAHQAADDYARQAALQAIGAAGMSSGETGLVVRPAYDVDVRLIDRSVANLIRMFADGRSLGEAAELLDNDAEQFGGMLGYIFASAQSRPFGATQTSRRGDPERQPSDPRTQKALRDHLLGDLESYRELVAVELSLAARLFFSSVLMFYFLNSAATKVGSGFPGSLMVRATLMPRCSRNCSKASDTTPARSHSHRMGSLPMRAPTPNSSYRS